VIELRRGKLLGRPGATRGERDGAPPVVRLDHPLVVVRRDPEIVVVAVWHGEGGIELHAPIVRAKEIHVEHVHPVAVLRICGDVGVVEGTLPQLAVVVGALPGGAGVVGAEDAALRILDDGPDAVAVHGADRDSDAPDHAGGQAGIARDLGPVLTGVGAPEQSAARATAGHLPGGARRLPGGGEENVGMLRIEGEVDGATRVVAVEHLPPALAAVGGLEHPALHVASMRMAEGGDVDDVRIARVDADLRDRVRLGEPNVRPGLAGVDRLVDAIPLHDVPADAGLAHAGVDDVGVGLRDRQRADGAGAKLAVGDGIPGGPAVEGLPDTPTHRAEVVLEGPRRAAGDGDRTAAAIGADGTPLHAPELLRVHRVGSAGRVCAASEEAARRSGRAKRKVERIRWRRVGER
jgi:hypothetical protein